MVRSTDLEADCLGFDPSSITQGRDRVRHSPAQNLRGCQKQPTDQDKQYSNAIFLKIELMQTL